MNLLQSTLPVLSEIGDPGFAIGMGNFANQNVSTHIGYRKEWAEHYASKGYIREDPVIIDGLKSSGITRWRDPDTSNNVVVQAARDFGIKHGLTISHKIGGHFCIVGVAVKKALSKPVEREISKMVELNHIDHLLDQTNKLSALQIDLISLFAAGLRAKEVAHLFEISEDAIKQRKITIQKALNVNSFLVVINLCAMAGLTLPRIS